jgi:hypothetical protein
MIASGSQKMVSRSELEGLVTFALHEIRVAESNLERRYRLLAKAGSDKRLWFLCSLGQLGRRASQLEY